MNFHLVLENLGTRLHVEILFGRTWMRPTDGWMECTNITDKLRTDSTSQTGGEGGGGRKGGGGWIHNECSTDRSGRQTHRLLDYNGWMGTRDNNEKKGRNAMTPRHVRRSCLLFCQSAFVARLRAAIVTRQHTSDYWCQKEKASQQQYQRQ